MKHLGLLAFCLMGFVSVPRQSMAGWFSTPKSVMQDGEWNLESLWGKQLDPSTELTESWTVIVFSFRDGTILRKNERVTLAGGGDFKEGAWVKMGTYAFTDRNTMLVFWGESTVSRKVAVYVNEDSRTMSWIMVIGNTDSGRRPWMNFIRGGTLSR